MHTSITTHLCMQQVLHIIYGHKMYHSIHVYKYYTNLCRKQLSHSFMYASSTTLNTYTRSITSFMYISTTPIYVLYTTNTASITTPVQRSKYQPIYVHKKYHTHLCTQQEQHPVMYSTRTTPMQVHNKNKTHAGTQKEPHPCMY